MSKTFFITTPLYYVNAAPHIGHSYTNVAADCLARYHRLKAQEVFLLTGTDEHGQKIEQAAKESGKSPQVFVDEVVERFQSLWATLQISYDDFIRTTQARHVRAVKVILSRLHDAGKLKRTTYQGWYCTPDETFWTEEELRQLKANPQGPVCPSCQRVLEPTREEGWYLPLRQSQEWLRTFVKAHPTFVRPQTRYNELLSLLEQPLPEYLCITRPKRRVGWGIPVPFSEDHVTYVWFDALLNYITVVGFVDDPARFAQFWPADVHLIGKDILRHHAVYWPIMLHTLGFSDDQMPRTIVAHGWWKVDEQKMSKSLGNIVNPQAIVTQLLQGQPHAADVYRYFLLRDVPFGQDGSFSQDAILARLQADLANDLGNLVHRTLSMITRYCAGRIPRMASVGCAVDDAALQHSTVGLGTVVDEAMARLEFSVALDAIMRVVGQANRYLESQAPWQLSKEGQKSRLESVLRIAAEVLRVVSIHLEPFMPSVSEAIRTQLGCGQLYRWIDGTVWPGLPDAQAIGKPSALFPLSRSCGVSG